MKGIVCKVCGYVAIDGQAPEKCPVCGSPKEAFEEKEDGLKVPVDSSNMTEGEKKHTPVIKTVDVCGLVPEGCKDVHVRIGEIMHPTLPEHFITHIDFYIDDKFASRVMLTPEKLNPAAALHLKPGSEKLSVVARCNVHGAWLAEIAL